MRISDWSSDVCSSDLSPDGGFGLHVYPRGKSPAPGAAVYAVQQHSHRHIGRAVGWYIDNDVATAAEAAGFDGHEPQVVPLKRPEERRVGKEGVGTCRSRWSQCP